MLLGAHVLLLPDLVDVLGGGGGAHVLLLDVPDVPVDGLGGGGGGSGSFSELQADFNFFLFSGSSAAFDSSALGLRGFSSELHVPCRSVILAEAAAVPPPGPCTEGGEGIPV